METGLNASACVDKQPIVVATASTVHPIGCKTAANRMLGRFVALLCPDFHRDGALMIGGVCPSVCLSRA